MTLMAEGIARMAFKQARRLNYERKLQARNSTSAKTANQSMRWERHHEARIVELANTLIRQHMLTG